MDPSYPQRCLLSSVPLLFLLFHFTVLTSMLQLPGITSPIIIGTKSSSQAQIWESVPWMHSLEEER